MRKKGFTLIELLVVISIIGLLASMVLVSLEVGKEKARLARAIEFAGQVDRVLMSDCLISLNFEEDLATTLPSDSCGGEVQIYGNGSAEGDTIASDPDGVNNSSAVAFNGKMLTVTPKDKSISKGIAVSTWMKTDKKWYWQLYGFYGSTYLWFSNNLYGQQNRAIVGIITSAGGISTSYYGIFMSPDLNNNKWHHILVSFFADASNGLPLKVFIDGEQQKTEVEVSGDFRNIDFSVFSDSPFPIAGSYTPWGGGTPAVPTFIGSIDNFRVFAKPID